MSQYEKPGLGRQMGGQIDPGPEHPQKEGGGQAGVLPGPIGGPHRVEQPPPEQQIGDQGINQQGRRTRQPYPCRQGLPGELGGSCARSLDCLARLRNHGPGVDRVGGGDIARGFWLGGAGERPLLVAGQSGGGRTISRNRLGDGGYIRQRLGHGGEGTLEADRQQQPGEHDEPQQTHRLPGRPVFQRQAQQEHHPGGEGPGEAHPPQGGESGEQDIECRQHNRTLLCAAEAGRAAEKLRWSILIDLLSS